MHRFTAWEHGRRAVSPRFDPELVKDVLDVMTNLLQANPDVDEWLPGEGTEVDVRRAMVRSRAPFGPITIAFWLSRST